MEDLGGTLGGIAIAGNIAVVAQGGLGVHFLEISDPDAPLYIGSRAIPDARDLVIADGLVYVAAGAHGISVATLPECG